MMLQTCVCVCVCVCVLGGLVVRGQRSRLTPLCVDSQLLSFHQFDEFKEEQNYFFFSLDMM